MVDAPREVAALWSAARTGPETLGPDALVPMADGWAELTRDGEVDGWLLLVRSSGHAGAAVDPEHLAQRVASSEADLDIVGTSHDGDVWILIDTGADQVGPLAERLQRLVAHLSDDARAESWIVGGRTSGPGVAVELCSRLIAVAGEPGPAIAVTRD